MATTIWDEPVLRVVGRYELLREVGRGGTAIVYAARQRDLGRLVALKELAAFHAAKPVVVERFLRESRVTGALNHPNVVTVHEYLEHDGTAFIAMEYFERGSVRPWARHLELTQIAGVLEGVLAGLAHAEKHGVVHRDLKPENLMVTSAGAIKITDFGIAKALQLSGLESLTAAGTAVGTPAYMAPEQALGTEIGPWTDLYAVGVIAYEMLAGDVPFPDGELPLVTLLQHANEPIPPLADVDPALSRWVERMLAKDPDERPASARDAWDELEEIAIRILGPRWRRDAQLAGDPSTLPTRPKVHAVHAEAATAALPGGRRLSRWLAAGVAVVLLAAAGVAALAHERGGPAAQAQRPLPDFVPAASEQVAVAVAGPSLVVAQPNGRLVQLDRTTLQVQRVLRDPARPRGVAVGHGHVYVSDSEGVTTRRAATLAPVAAVSLPGATALAAGGALVVASRNGRLCELGRGARVCGRVDFTPTGVGASDSGDVIAVADGGTGRVAFLRRSGRRLVPTGSVVAVRRPHGELVFYGGRVYVASERGIAIVDPLRATATTTKLPVSPSAIWIGPTGRLYALLPATGSLAILDVTTTHARPRMVAVGGEPVAITGTAQTLFVADRSGRMSKLDARTGAPQNSVRIAAPAVRPPERVRLARVSGRASRDDTVLTLTLIGGRLDAGGVIIRDAVIKDGRTQFELWQGGIRTSVRRRSFGDVTVRVDRSTARLVVRVATAPRAFSRFRVRRTGGRLVVELVRPPRTVVTRPSSGSSSGGSSQQPQQPPTTPNCCDVG